MLTGVSHIYLLSPFLFSLVIDWKMRQTTEKHRDGIQLALMSRFGENLDFADDAACFHASPGRAIQACTNGKDLGEARP